jgi:uncharacterized sulfatase
MTGRSLKDVLKSAQQGLVDPSRDAVIVGRERHVAKARLGNLPYPQRAIRTKNYLYIRNFEPGRYAMGNAPGFGLADGPMPAWNPLQENTFSAFGDLDASPTKAWMLTNLDKPSVRNQVELTMGLRPAEELYYLPDDPDHMSNLADRAEFASVKTNLSARLMKVLRETGDPRVAEEEPILFEASPFTD